MLRSSGLTLVLATVLLSAGNGAAAAPWPGDHLRLTVTNSGDPANDGTFELSCHPAAGSHPAPQAACDRLDELTRWGEDPFAPVPPGTQCSLQYGGPATAHLEGTWAGRPVDTDFRRSDGCEIVRWDRFPPLLPPIRS
ncbi:SSI family serine proteinase inhibitor [Streptomyces sp. NPDC050856]|uniref:SSI family serine proteinase inhibitor n=1 Tax=Streptomyces sp. NPDC050856 TaxID=3154939 RepID=UPI0033D856A3